VVPPSIGNKASSLTASRGDLTKFKRYGWPFGARWCGCFGWNAMMPFSMTSIGLTVSSDRRFGWDLLIMGGLTRMWPNCRMTTSLRRCGVRMVIGRPRWKLSGPRNGLDVR
jgi:hypothetical protein